MIEGLTEGRIVHYVLADGPSKGEHRPAIVVKVWSKDTGCCNLQVMTDYTNDGQQYAAGHLWATSVLPSEEATPGTWHFIERA